MSEKQPLTTYKHTTTYIIQGIPYALTSICALFAGYFIQLNFNSLPLFLIDFLILSIPVIASIYFFMCYAERFPTPQLESSEEDKIELAIRGEAIYTYLILAASLIGNTILSACLIASLTGNSLPLWYISAFLIHAGMYVYYGLFLWRHPDPDSIPVIRHQLVWSVVLSIGVSLYYGLNYSNLADSWLPIVPLLILGGVYVGVMRVSENSFLGITTSSFFVSTILAFLITKGSLPFLPVFLGEYLFSIQFCIIVSAYLAVFEAWKITSDIAKKEQKRTGTSISQDINSEAHRYSMATLVALVISIWALPFFFIFSQYGILFLVFFGLHSLFSFWFWSSWGVGQNLIKLNWGIHKIWTGVIFLGILVLTSFPFFNSQPTSRTLEDFVSWSGLGTYSVFTASLPVGLLANSLFKRSGTIWEVFAERINFTRFLSLLSCFACAVLLFVIPIYDKNSVVYFKGDLAFIFYCICILICFIVEIRYNLNKPKLNNTIVNKVLAFLVLIRAVTSFLIALAVFLPSIYIGNSFWESILTSLPFFLSATGGFALNDYFDAQKDLINKPYRAIPSGRLSRSFVLSCSVISLSLAFLGAKLFSQNNIEFVLYILCICGVTSYNLFVKYLSLSKTFLTSIVSALPLLFSVIVYGYPKIYLLLPVATCSFILGREWLMDIRDIKGDSAEGIKTIPMLLGSATTAKIGFGFQLLAALFLLPIAIYNWSVWSTSLLTLIFCSVAILIPLWSYRSGLFQQRVVQLLWLPMFFGLLLFVR